MTYNRLGQIKGRTDQRGVVRSFLYDKLGRLNHDCATSLGGSGVVNGTVRRISRFYEVRGMLNKISSYSDPVVGFGSIDNEVTMDYNEFTQLTKESQSHSGAVSSSPNVQYAYANGSINTLRPTSLTYPNGRVISYDYGSGTDDDRLCRVTNIKDGATALAGYAYLGAGTVIRIDYAQPGVRLDLWGGTSGSFGGIDLFGRVIDQRWITTGGSPTDRDRYKYGYDRNSNRQYRANVVGTAAVGNLDEYYTYDNLNRLTVMQRGTLTGTPPTGISGTPTAEQDWTLDPTGNWNGFVVKAAGSTTLNQSRTQNKVNEITAITASTGTDWADPVYDAAGNMTSMPKPSSLANSYTATYDAWNRMIQVKDGGTTIATYRYDGHNRRVTVDTGVVRHFYFTNSWREIEERLGSLTTADQQYVWGIRYIDELVCRDRLASSGSSSSSSSSGGGGLNERLYACQDANFNVTSLIDISAAVVERYSYDPYGTPTFRNASWADIGNSAKASNILYSGYQYDSNVGLYYARLRYFHASAANWTSRDPIEVGLSLYQYVDGTPTNATDPYGLYGKDVHYDFTQAAAMAAGFDQDTADLIARCDQGRDGLAAEAISNVILSEITLGLMNLWPGHQRRYNYHHPGAGPVGLLMSPQKPVIEGFSNDDVVQLLQDAAIKCDPCQLGRSLHALQDSYSHGGTITDADFNPVIVNGRIQRLPPDLGGHPKGRPLFPKNGKKGVVSGGVFDTSVDDVDNDPARYRAAQQDTRKALSDYRCVCK